VPNLYVAKTCLWPDCCFGGLVVSMLASGTKDSGLKPGRSRLIFSGVKIVSMPSFGRDVKQFVPCRRFAERKRTLLDYVEVGSLKPNYSDILRWKFPPSLTQGLQRSSWFAKCPYTWAALAPTGDERRRPKATRCTMGLYKAWVLTG
jgi:hypothetical protein